MSLAPSTKQTVTTPGSLSWSTRKNDWRDVDGAAVASGAVSIRDMIMALEIPSPRPRSRTWRRLRRPLAAADKYREISGDDTFYVLSWHSIVPAGSCPEISLRASSDNSSVAPDVELYVATKFPAIAPDANWSGLHAVLSFGKYYYWR